MTNRRVVQVEGVLNKRAADSSLEKINDAVLDQNVVGRMLGYGDLEVLTASESAIDRFHMLARAADFKREMLNQKHALEMRGRALAEPAASGRPAGRPRRARAARVAWRRAVRAGSAGTLTIAARRTAAGTAAASEQTMATLARLADLRDRGAITPEEFERKKAELLARL